MEGEYMSMQEFTKKTGFSNTTIRRNLKNNTELILELGVSFPFKTKHNRIYFKREKVYEFLKKSEINALEELTDKNKKS
jgi:hypothetical protein